MCVLVNGMWMYFVCTIVGMLVYVCMRQGVCVLVGGCQYVSMEWTCVSVSDRRRVSGYVGVSVYVSVWDVCGSEMCVYGVCVHGCVCACVNVCLMEV